MPKKVEHAPVTFRHILADGREVDSIEGHVIPEGHPFYRTYARILVNIAERKAKAEEAKNNVV